MYLSGDEWNIVENSFSRENLLVSESVFAQGNGKMGMRANFEENFSGDTIAGSYVGGVYYSENNAMPNSKNLLSQVFSKQLNACNWIGLQIQCDGQNLDLNSLQVVDFERKLKMKEGVVSRKFTAKLQNSTSVSVDTTRLLSLVDNECAAISYSITADADLQLEIKSYLDFNGDKQALQANTKYWRPIAQKADPFTIYVQAQTKNTLFDVAVVAHTQLFVNNVLQQMECQSQQCEMFATNNYSVVLKKGECLQIVKYIAVTSSRFYPASGLKTAALESLATAKNKSFSQMLVEQEQAWAQIWQQADIVIDGDLEAQQAIRFAIFQLYQHYNGNDEIHSLSTHGFTSGKKAGISWSADAFCLPFYLYTAESKTALQLLKYRHKQLNKAIENAAKLGFTGGAALFPMQSLNGNESHTDWEIALQEIHRNGAIAFAIFKYIRYTGDDSYLLDGGLEILIAIARFWTQRINFSDEKQQYVLLGVNGPNEYESNVNNNWYTSYMAVWCLKFTKECLQKVQVKYPTSFLEIIENVDFEEYKEVRKWNNIIDKMYFPFDKKRGIALQHEGFLDKELMPVSVLPVEQLPISKHWSWDKILRSCFSSQADVLQAMYFFEQDFDKALVQTNFEFYEALTLHESPLSPGIHSILASYLGKADVAYRLFLQSVRNILLEEGLHIPSMACTWLAVVEGFVGLRIKNATLYLYPLLPKQWKSVCFKIHFRERKLLIEISDSTCSISLLKGNELKLLLWDEAITITENECITRNIV